jgi:Tfp pilus assembly PilM family ATPase
MAQILAIDWDDSEVRYVRASTANRRLKIRTLEAVSISEGQENGDSPSVGAALQQALSKKKPSRATVLAAAGRADVEFLSMTLPPANDHELPEMVAHETLRLSPQLADDGVIDFVPLAENASEPRSVTAAVCPAEQIQRVTRNLETAGLTPTRLLVRPYALASFARMHSAGDEQPSLLVCRVGDEVDLAVVAEARVVYSRTVRLPTQIERSASCDRLVAEIRRTLLVAPPPQLTDETIEQVLVIGSEEEQRPFADLVTRELTLPVRVIDPMTGRMVPPTDQPDHVERFAPLIGMLQDEMDGRHAIDFLNPRKPPAPPNRRRQLIAAAGVLIAIAAAGMYYVWDSLGELDAANAQLSGELRELEQTLKKATVKRVLRSSLERWEAESITWLDELRDFSTRFPSSRDAVVLRMSLSRGRGGGGEIDLNGLVRDPAIILRMENSIRDDFHQIRSKRIQERGQEKNYNWHFESLVNLEPRDRDQYIAGFVGEQPVTDPADDEAPTVPVAATAATNELADGADSREAASDE